jgi:hypothetical protein
MAPLRTSKLTNESLRRTQRQFPKFADWEFGKIRKYTDCESQRSSGKEKYNGPCDNLLEADHTVLQGKMIGKMTIRDSDDFRNAPEAEAGMISDWIELCKSKEEVNDCSTCQGSSSCLCYYKDVTITGIPVLKKEFGTPDPKVIAKSMDLEAARNDISARFFDIVAGIWDGSNGDVVQVLSVSVFSFCRSCGLDGGSETESRGDQGREEEFHQHYYFGHPFLDSFCWRNRSDRGRRSQRRLHACDGRINCKCRFYYRRGSC